LDLGAIAGDHAGQVACLGLHHANRLRGDARLTGAVCETSEPVCEGRVLGGQQIGRKARGRHGLRRGRGAAAGGEGERAAGGEKGAAGDDVMIGQDRLRPSCEWKGGVCRRSKCAGGGAMVG